MNRYTALLVLLTTMNASADTEIHRCTQADGTIAFQEMPCEENAPAASAAASEQGESRVEKDAVLDFVNPYDEPETPPDLPPVTVPEQLSQNRADCEKTTRDAIDVIDLEMRQTRYSKEQGEQYLAQLLVLTRQLRACKDL